MSAGYLETEEGQAGNGNVSRDQGGPEVERFWVVGNVKEVVELQGHAWAQGEADRGHQVLLVDLGGLASGAFEAGQIRTRGSANLIFGLTYFDLFK